MRRYFPIFLDLEGKDALVVGAGTVAERKAQGLLKARARVTVVGPAPVKKLRELARRRRIRLLPRPFRSSDVARPSIVVAATNDEALNRRISEICARRGIWINVVDRPRLCSFIVPSVVSRGRLTVAISTNGLSPALSKWIRKKLERDLGNHFGTLLSHMAALRRRAIRTLPTPPARLRVLSALLRPEIVALYQNGQAGTGRKRLDALFAKLCAGEIRS